MNISAISSFNNAAKVQSFKAEASKLYRDPHEIIPADVSDDTVVDYSTWGDNYPVPITAGQRRESQRKELARLAAEANYASTQPTQVPVTTPLDEPLTPEEIYINNIGFLRD